LFFQENEEFEIRNGIIVMNLNGIYVIFVVFTPQIGCIRDKIVGDTNIKAISNIEYKYFK